MRGDHVDFPDQDVITAHSRYAASPHRRIAAAPCRWAAGQDHAFFGEVGVIKGLDHAYFPKEGVITRSEGAAAAIAAIG
ncbi:hypothetical protein F4553_003573 [Allocatelliglobosispora scoriae]|uniref:Uncharacterized protein n=1 Tax=Allocatelliglobosispora scoriae TaxID=643052 RepID=A0A841BPJ3_9ACTN|nr:hypothetical protein [Allocatelliglobosispora scoriae]MBB5870194.1 hypothetical protein [Allocatelliglobosispora scoriae]